MDSLLKKYVLLNDAYNQLEEERDTLRQQIVKEFQNQKIEKHNTDFGHFSLGHRYSYTYTDKIKDLENKVKIAKHKEEVSGKAIEKVTDYLIFKVPTN